MVDQVTIHFEGHHNLRSGFHKLFESHVTRARHHRIRFELIAGGPRSETVKDFLRSCASSPSDLNVLLIDSEQPVPSTVLAIQELRSLRIWDSHATCGDDQINLMVQAMESWFVSDPATLIRHFGPHFNRNALPSPQNTESISPGELTEAIRRGLRPVGRRRDYDKVRDGATLLKLIDRSTVSRHCPHFRRLMDFLSREI